jgi:site-specific DNA-methyltransferase (adenine-specific)
MTPYYDHNGITIYCEECSKAMADVLLDDSIDLTVTSPPYDDLREYQGYVFDFEAIARQLWRVTKQGGVVVWVVADATVNGSETLNSFRQALFFQDLGFNVHDTMIYQTNKPPMNNNNRYQSCFEFMFVFSKGKPKTANILTELSKHPGVINSGGMRDKDGKKRKRTYINKTLGNVPKQSIWYLPRSSTSDDKLRDRHPATFPEALARDHIISWSNPGDIILDPLCGSGTTLKMAQALGRRAIGIEISEEYCQIAVERLRQPSLFSIIKPEPKQQGPEQLTLGRIPND